MDRQELKQRLIAFAARVFRLQSVVKRRGAPDFANQMVRSSSSVGANYHEAIHARSRTEFIAKIKLAESEAEETHYWISLVASSGIVKPELLANLIDEARQIVAILHATAETSKNNPSGTGKSVPAPPTNKS